MSVRYTVELFGGFAVRSADGAVLTRFRSRQTTSLLAYLAYHPIKPYSREVLADMFWPTASTSENARLSLSVALSNLRGQLEKPPVPSDSVFVATSTTLAIQHGAIETDVQKFEQLLTEEKWEEAVDAYTGPLLPGFYDEWVTAEQTRLRDRFHYTVVQLRRRCEEQGDIEGALRWHRLTVQGDPTDRDAVAALLTALCQAGRYEEAARTFYEVERRLRDEYDEAISPRLRAENADLLARYPSPFQKRGRGRPKLVNGTGGRVAEVRIDDDISPSTERVILAVDSQTALSSPTPDPRPSPLAHTLPLQLRRIIGRDTEMAELEARFLAPEGDRLLTLTGMTGIGKTQLAIALAHRIQEHGKRVFFIPLLTLRREDQILSDVAEAVGTQDSSSDSLLAATARALEAEPTVLILDNFEHLINTKAANLVGQLLARSPSMKCLITSQKRLPIPGEVAFPVPPLAAPSETDLTWETSKSEELLTRYPAMALFEERAKNVQHDFNLNPTNRRAVADLVRALNGVPLAIELAAARINILGPQEIKVALTERITLLASSRIDPEDRHHSLQASLQWSYDLLPPPVQQLFRRISVFRGGFAAADVADVADELLAFDYLALLSDASLLHSTYTSHGVRLSLLDIVRLFAEEQMSNAEKASARHRHALLFSQKAEQARTKWRTAEETVWLGRLSADQDNLSAVCHWLLSQNAPMHLEQAYRIGTALNHYWKMRGRRAEGIAFFKELLCKPLTDVTAPHGIVIPVDIRISALNALGSLYILQELFDDAHLWLHEAKVTTENALLVSPIPEIPARERQLAGIRVNLALLAEKREDFTEALSLLEEMLAYYRRIGDKRSLGVTLSNLGAVALDAQDFASSLRYSQEARIIAQSYSDQSTVAATYGNDGEAYLLQGELAKAEAAWRVSLEIYHALPSNDLASLILLRLTAIMERRDNTPLIQFIRTAASTYRQVAGLPLDDLMRPPYNLFFPPQTGSLPSLISAEARLREAIEHILRLPSSTGSGEISPFGDSPSPLTTLLSVVG